MADRNTREWTGIPKYGQVPLIVCVQFIPPSTLSILWYSCPPSCIPVCYLLDEMCSWLSKYGQVSLIVCVQFIPPSTLSILWYSCLPSTIPLPALWSPFLPSVFGLPSGPPVYHLVSCLPYTLHLTIPAPPPPPPTCLTVAQSTMHTWCREENKWCREENNLIVPRREQMVPRREQMVPRREQMVPRREQMVPRREQMVQRREIVLWGHRTVCHLVSLSILWSPCMSSSLPIDSLVTLSPILSHATKLLLPVDVYFSSPSHFVLNIRPINILILAHTHVI